MKKSRLLLLALPFGLPDRPNIGLSLLKSAAAEAGFECDIKYLNIDFAAEIGKDNYMFISRGSRQEALIGDAVFAEALHGHKIDFTKLYSSKRTFLYNELSGKIGMLEEVSKKARDLVHKNIASIPWEDYSLVGFTAMFQIMPSLAFSYHLKQNIKQAPPVIFGGPQCDGPLGKAVHKSFPWIDFICCGEGETLIKSVLSSLEAGELYPSHIPGLIYRENGQSITNGLRTMPENLDALPYTDYTDWQTQLNNSGLYFGEVAPDLAIPIETSRGCWYGEKAHCTFCGLNGEGMAFRRKNPDRAFKEIMDTKRYAIDTAFAVDNILDYNYFNTLLPRLAKVEDKPNLFYEIKANVKKDQLRLMKDAGIRMVQPGIESLNTNILKVMNKGVQSIQNIQLLKWSAEIGISLAWNLLYDFPGEEPKSYKEMEELVPKIIHLQPPIGGCFPIRLDRFSPLHFNASKLGVKSLEISPAYTEVFQCDGVDLEGISSFFEFEREDGLDARIYTEGLQENVDEWLSSCGKFALIHWDDGEVVNVIDTRPLAKVNHVSLSGVEREVLLACDSGQLPTKVSKDLGIPEADVCSIIDQFISNGWFVELDKRIISLTVSMNSKNLNQYPASLHSVIFTEAYKSNMTNIFSVFKE